MDINVIKSDIKERVGKSKLDEAIIKLRSRLNPNSPKLDELILIRYANTKLKEDRNNGTKSTETIHLQENKLVNNILQFIDSLDESDLILSEDNRNSKKKTDSFSATGRFMELRISQFENDFKSRHLLSNFDYPNIETFSGEMYDLILSREGDKLVFAGEQIVTFRKKNNEKTGTKMKEYIYGQGYIIGEYAYIDYSTRQFDGVVVRKGKQILNISDNEKIYGYFMTPDIELPGIIAMGRVEIKIERKL